MKKMNNKGFTLVELIAIVVLLALVMGIGAISVTKIINNAKEKDYQLLVENIKSAVELYYQECKYSNDMIIDCPSLNSGWYYIYLEDLVDNGFIKGNAATSDDTMYLTNTMDGKDISRCRIKYRYYNWKIEIKYASGGSSCPTDDDYNS